MQAKQWLVEAQYLLEYLLLWPLVALIRHMSEARSRWLAIGLSRVAYRILSFDRRWALRNLELVYGDQLTAGQRTRLAMKAFENVFLTRVETLRWSPEWMAANVTVEGWETILDVRREAARSNRGLIFISAHLGNYELLPPHVHGDGWKGAVVYRPQNNWRVERLIAGARGKYLQRFVPRGAAGLLTLRRNLRNGAWAGLIVDVNTLSHPVFADFLGYRAASPRGAAALALATGCPVVLCVSTRQADGRHRLVFLPPFRLIETGDRERDIAANTQQYMTAIEPHVLANPEQYNWLHPRWRFRPDGAFWRLETPIDEMRAERTAPPLPFAPASPGSGAATRAA